MEPSKIVLHQQSKRLELVYDNQHYLLAAEYLRVYSPSAEVQGHGLGLKVLPQNKENVGIVALEPVGQYAIRIIFDDGHNSGLFSWPYLYSLATEQSERWQTYLTTLEQAGIER